MNQLDKLVAQRNGPDAGLPPFHKYIIIFEPQGNEFVNIENEEKSTFAVIGSKKTERQGGLFGLGQKQTEYKKKIAIDMNLLTFRYNFYYDDPEETEEERLAIINRLNLGDGLPSNFSGYKSEVVAKIQFYEPKADIKFEKRIKKLDYSYHPISELPTEEEINQTDEADKLEDVVLYEPIDKPTKGFMDSIRHLLKGRD